MGKTFDLLLRNGEILAKTKDGVWSKSIADIGITDGKVKEIGNLHGCTARQSHSIEGLTVFPGFIDTQVHLREPGLDHKETFLTGSGSAVLGGVTSVFDMPNTQPPLIDEDSLNKKMTLAQNRFWCDYAFYLGGHPETYKDLPKLESRAGVCGVKVFLGPSTGHLVLNEIDSIRYLMSHLKKIISFHCEDADRLKERARIVEGPDVQVALHSDWRDEDTAFIATQLVAQLARQEKKRIHVLHITSKKEIEFLKSQKEFVSVEVTPQHLTLSAPSCYEKLGTHAQMNPPIRTIEHQQALWEGIANGTVDVIGSDHAPHTLEEKKRAYPASPSGMPGVQTIAPLMIDHALNNRLTLFRVIELLCANPARIFGIRGKGSIEVGKDADLAILDLKGTTTISNETTYSKCGWTPFDGYKLKGRIAQTFLRGQMVMSEGQLIGNPMGRPLNF